jgi:hypothetical protein
MERFVLVNPFRFDGAEARAAFEPGLREAEERSLTPVISHEALSGQPNARRYYGREVAERLREAFPEAKVVIGIREQRSMVMSLYRQHIRTGGYYTIREYIGTGSESAGFEPMCRLDWLEYHLLVEHYQRLFGAENVLVLPLEWLRMGPAGYLRRLLRFAGHTPREAPDGYEISNRGWGGLTLALRRRANLVIRKRPMLGGPSPAYRLLIRMCNALDRLTPEALDNRVERPIRRFIERRTRGCFAESNDRLQRVTDLDLGALGYELPHDLSAAAVPSEDAEPTVERAPTGVDGLSAGE